jgi:sugar phosphate isomerase/epimerase
MIVAGNRAIHLTYCTNIHAGETWDEIFANVRTHVLAVKERIGPDRKFGIGLRLSALAARQLVDPEVLGSFAEFLEDRGLYVFTINGFPYGAFAGTAVKERVYRPDWLEDERVTYTDLLARILAALVPEDMEGSISSVPGCFRARGRLADVGSEIAARLRRHAAHAWRLRESTGRTITLALEPEPHCVLETTADAVTFFEQHLFCTSSVREFSTLTGLAPSEAERALRRHLGVCLDACHAAVEFEKPDEAVARIIAGGIRVLKVQVSAGLRVQPPNADSRAALERFAEGVYLHQVVVQKGDDLTRFVDLPEALADASARGRTDQGDEWRVHFHVPVFRERLGPFQNTQEFLRPLLARIARGDVCDHLEVETYSWDVLPEEHRREPVVDAIARELAWTIDGLTARSGSG